MFSKLRRDESCLGAAGGTSEAARFRFIVKASLSYLGGQDTPPPRLTLSASAWMCAGVKKNVGETTSFSEGFRWESVG